MIRISVFALSLAASSAVAQTADNVPTSVFDPADPAKSRPVEYRSVFTPQPVPGGAADWRRANEEMGRLRGHAGQLREPANPPSVGAAPAAGPTAPAPAHHAH